MKTEIIQTLIEQLDRADEQLGDPLDIPRSERAFRAFWERKRSIAAAKDPLVHLPPDLASAESDVQRWTALYQESHSKEVEIEQALSALPNWQDVTDRHEQRRVFAESTHLERQLELLRSNRLLKSPDQCFENPADLKTRVETLTRKRDQLAANLETAMANAEALVSATTTSTSAAPAPVPVAK